MKKLFLFGLIGLCLFVGLYAKQYFNKKNHRSDYTTIKAKQPQDFEELKTGDIIFQISLR